MSGASVDVEIRFLTVDRHRELSALKSGDPAVQRVVVVNSDARGYDYAVWTTVDGEGLSYPESKISSDQVEFRGKVGFDRRQLEVRGVDHFEEVVYDASGRTQPTHVAIFKKLHVGDVIEGGWTQFELGSDFVECNP